MANIFELLRQREIIDVLIGDKDFGEHKGIKIAMPYRSGSDLCSLSTQFGNPKTYSWGGGNLSRWAYMDDLLEYCLSKNKMQQLLSYLFDKGQFESVFKPSLIDGITLSQTEITDIHKHIIVEIVKAINHYLYFGGHELKIIGGQFAISNIGATIKIEAPKIKLITREYISDLSERANKDIEENSFDSAITKCRTLSLFRLCRQNEYQVTHVIA